MIEAGRQSRRKYWLLHILKTKITFINFFFFWIYKKYVYFKLANTANYTHLQSTVLVMIGTWVLQMFKQETGRWK